jgi:hypothetical protein
MLPAAFHLTVLTWERGANYSPLSSAKAKNAGSFTSTLPLALTVPWLDSVKIFTYYFGDLQ